MEVTHKDVRKPAVAGQFYPSGKEELLEQLDRITEQEKLEFDSSAVTGPLIGGVVPHAAYFYSGVQAVHFFSLLKEQQVQIDTFVIVHPNHRSMHPPLALDTNNAWETPLGQIELDGEMSRLLNLPYSEQAHQREHSAEIMLPLLQYFVSKPFRILPISMGVQSFENARLLASKLLKAAAILSRKIMLIASTDFSHFLPPDKGRQMDEWVIQEVLSMNTEGVEQVVENKNISICGYGPVMTLMEYAKGSSLHPHACVLKRGCSGDVVRSDTVVDYVSMAFFNQA